MSAGTELFGQGPRGILKERQGYAGRPGASIDPERVAELVLLVAAHLLGQARPQRNKAIRTVAQGRASRTARPFHRGPPNPNGHAPPAACVRCSGASSQPTRKSASIPRRRLRGRSRSRSLSLMIGGETTRESRYERGNQQVNHASKAALPRRTGPGAAVPVSVASSCLIWRIGDAIGAPETVTREPANQATRVVVRARHSAAMRLSALQAR